MQARSVNIWITRFWPNAKKSAEANAQQPGKKDRATPSSVVEDVKQHP